MSWLSKNYEKAALGGGIVVALGLGVLGWLKLSGTEADFATEFAGSGNNTPSVKDSDLVTKASSSLTSPRIWDQADLSGRPVDLFTGIPLFLSKSSGGKPLDLVKGEDVHPPITNHWWLQYRLDPGFGDSPQRDPDGDGFSNLEEFHAKTDPTNAADFPSVIAKLQYIRDESVSFYIRPGFDAGDGALGFTYLDSQRRENKTKADAPVKPGETFFAEGVAKGRFKFLGAEVRNVRNERLNADEQLTFVRIEDQQPNKKGHIYEIQQSFNLQRDVAKFTQFDRTAVLVLDALGNQGKEFKIEENTTFALPPDSPKKEYLLKSVTPEGIEVEYGPEGAKKTIQIQKR